MLLDVVQSDVFSIPSLSKMSAYLMYPLFCRPILKALTKASRLIPLTFLLKLSFEVSL